MWIFLLFLGCGGVGCTFRLDLKFQGQQQQQPAITPPVSSTGVWRLAALSVTVCLNVSPSHTHTHTPNITERALQLVTGCFSQSAASLFNTHLSIQLLSALISSPASKLRYALFKSRPTAESGPRVSGGRISCYLGGESRVLTLLHLGILILVRLVPKHWRDLQRKRSGGLILIVTSILNVKAHRQLMGSGESSC